MKNINIENGGTVVQIDDSRLIEYLLGSLILTTGAIAAWGARQWVSRGKEIDKLAKKLPYFVSRDEQDILVKENARLMESQIKQSLEIEALRATVETGRIHIVKRTSGGYGYAIIENTENN